MQTNFVTSRKRSGEDQVAHTLSIGTLCALIASPDLCWSRHSDPATLPTNGRCEILGRYCFSSDRSRASWSASSMS
jgi:hypothetical protein